MRRPGFFMPQQRNKRARCVEYMYLCADLIGFLGDKVVTSEVRKNNRVVPWKRTGGPKLSSEANNDDGSNDKINQN